MNYLIKKSLFAVSCFGIVTSLDLSVAHAVDHGATRSVIIFNDWAEGVEICNEQIPGGDYLWQPIGSGYTRDVHYKTGELILKDAQGVYSGQVNDGQVVVISKFIEANRKVRAPVRPTREYHDGRAERVTEPILPSSQGRRTVAPAELRYPVTLEDEASDLRRALAESARMAEIAAACAPAEAPAVARRYPVTGAYNHCSICFGAELVRTQCGHFFHQDCLEQVTEGTCPNCRADLMTGAPAQSN